MIDFFVDRIMCSARRTHRTDCRCFGEIFTVDGIDGRFVSHPESQTIIIYCHGNRCNICSCTYFAEFIDFANVVLFDYHGFGTSTNTPVSPEHAQGYATYSPEGLALDTRTVIEFIQELFPDHKIIVYAHSLGAGVALAAVPLLRKPVDGLILEGAFCCLSDIVTLPRWMSWLIDLDGKFDSSRNISQIICPILIVHSVDDEVVPYSQSQMLETYANKGPAVKMLYLTGQHERPVYTETYKQALKDFLSEN